MIKRLALILGSMMLSGCSDACEVRSPADPVELLVGVDSFQPIEETLGRFHEHGLPREVEGNIYNVKCREQPVNRIIYRYSMDNAPGRLELVFYFGRLAEIRFHPDAPAIFFAAADRRGLPSKLGEEMEVGHKVLWVTGHSYTAETLGVADRRLVDRFTQWVREHD